MRYRKFDYEYMALVHKDKPVPKLPIVDLCEDHVQLPVEGAAQPVPDQTAPITPAWQRWNDYGIGCLLEGGIETKRGELVQAEKAFQHLLTLGDKARPHGYINLARVYFALGKLDDAARMLNAARPLTDQWWTVAWFNGLVNAENATDKKDFDAAIAEFTRIVDPSYQDPSRKLDFTQDYVVLDKLANILFKRALLEGDENPQENRRYLREAVTRYRQVLAIVAEDLQAHYGLSQVYFRLGNGVEVPSVPVDTATAEELQESVDKLAAKASPAARLELAGRLAQQLAVYGKAPTRPVAPKLPVLKGLLPALTQMHDAEGSAEMQAALAQALGHLHRELHALYKPDDHAKSRAIREASIKYTAANHAAQAIVIYPTTNAQRDAIRQRHTAP